MSIRFEALLTEDVRALQRGGRDANDQVPERKISDGGGIPCRHCLRLVPKGRPYLVLACRPFTTVHPYAELGPIFLCAEECPNGSTVGQLPPFLAAERYIVRGYDTSERIVYGTGQVIPIGEIIDYCRRLFERDAIAFAHVRSATNNCFHVRVERSGPVAQ